MESQQEISWNSALEKIIAQEGERASGLAWLHSECEQHYSKLNVWIALPVICLSTINGFISGASSSMFSDPRSASLGVGSVSLFTAILSTVGSFFAWAKRTEAHRISAASYLKLSKFISVEMALPKLERIAAKDILKVVRDQSERLLEISPAVPEFLKERYRQRFGRLTDVAHPEITNGIHKVDINRHTTATSPEPTPAVTLP